MIKRMLSCMVLFLAFLLAISFAQATITISQPEAVYNLGDSLNADSKVSYGQDIDAFLRVVLACESEDTLMYFSPISLDKGRTKTIQIDWPISKASGICHVSASLESNDASKLEETETNTFELTNVIDIDAEINKQLFRPSEELEIEGWAAKENGEDFEGNVIISIDKKEYVVETSNGDFSFSMELGSAIAPGTHNIEISAKDSYNNSGTKTLEFEAETIPTSLILEINNESFLPGELLVIYPKLLDQANNVMTKDILTKLSIPKEGFFGDETTLLEELVASGGSTEYRFLKETRPGTYTIEISFEKFDAEKTIDVLVFEHINFSIENDMLNVTNVGNVPYNRPIEILFKIENQTASKVIEPNLEVGQTKLFQLEAPKGTYEIEIKANDESTVFEPISLTGDVVAVIELKPERSANKSLLASVIFVVLVAAIIFAAYFTSKKEKYRTERKLKNMGIMDAKGHVKATKNDFTLKAVFAKHAQKLAANSLIPSHVYGTKQEITALSVLFEGNKDHADQFFGSVVEKIKMHQGVADLHGNDIVVMFNIVKQQKHDVAAIKAAQDIKDIAEKMNFKIKAGINTGFVTASSIGADKSVNYMDIGKTMSISKALASKAKANEILISESVHKRAGDAVSTRKTTPHHIGENRAIEVYAIGSSQASAKDDIQWFIERATKK